MHNLIEEFRRFKKGEVEMEDVRKSNEIEKLVRFDYSLFLMKEGLPFNKIGPIIKFFQDLIKKYSVKDLLKISLSNVTATKIITKCVSVVLRESILIDLANNSFSLSIDESSDIYGEGFLTITTKYIKEGALTTRLLSILPLGERKTGEALYNKIKEAVFSGINKEKIEKNFTGTCTDKARNMLGGKLGLASRLRRDCPYIVTSHDLSHIFNLVAETAVEKLPDDLLKMVKSISSHFSRSPLNSFTFKDLQRKMGREPSEILVIPTYTETRFLSLQETVDKILELWDCLGEYKKEVNTLSVDFTNENRVKLSILQGILQKLTSSNEFFQSDQHIYPKIYEKLISVFVSLSKIIVKKIHSEGKLNLYQEFENYYKIPWNKDEELKNNLFEDEKIKENYLDWQFIDENDYFENLSSDYKKEILQGIKNFIVQALSELKRLVPFEDFVLKHSKIIYLWSFEKELWKNMANHFVNVISNSTEKSKFGNELNEFETEYQGLVLQARIKENGNNLISLWEDLKNDYPYMAKLSLTMLVLPYSTCSVERIFSQVKNTKSSSRNRLQTENLEAALLAKEYFKDNPFEITDEMLKKYDKMWASQQKAPQLVPKPLSESQEEQISFDQNKESPVIENQKSSLKRKATENLPNHELGFLNKKIILNDSQEKYLEFFSDYSYSDGIRYVKPRTPDNHSDLDIN